MKKWLERGGPLVRLARGVVHRLRRDSDQAALALLEALAGGKRASVLDVYFAYRLLLGRAPDAGGFAHHRRRVDELQLLPQELASDFLRSAEHGAHRPAELPVDEQWVELEGFSLLVDTHDRVIGGHLARHRTWEPDVTRAVRTLLRPGDPFVDVGANIGYFTLLGAKQVGPKGTVIAVEPVPRNCALLRKSLARNDVPQVELLEVAAGAQNKVTRMVLPDRANGGSFAVVNGAPEGSFEVPLCRLDALIAGRPVRLVKLDVEGFETEALEGMEQTLKNHRPLLLLEYTPSRVGQTLLGTLRALGYGAQEVARFDGRFAGQSISELTAALARSCEGHLDLLLFPLGADWRG